MQWIIPGTVLRGEGGEAEHIEALFQPMFLAGGMVLSQVASLTGLEPYIVQNWVKRGFLAPPQNKRYSLRQLCRILNINSLRGVLPMERIFFSASMVFSRVSASIWMVSQSAPAATNRST